MSDRKAEFGQADRFKIVSNAAMRRAEKTANLRVPIPVNLTLEHPTVQDRTPIKFPDPPTREDLGRRMTTLGKGTHIYDLSSQARQVLKPAEAIQHLIGDIDSDAEQAEYIERIENGENMPSIRLGFDRPIGIMDPDGVKIEFQGVAFADRRGLDWDGMIAPSTAHKLSLGRQK